MLVTMSPICFEVGGLMRGRGRLPIVLNTSFDEDEPIVCIPEKLFVASDARAWMYSIGLFWL